ncbi:MAG: adenosylcobinamide-GDP ribazoletransferase [Thalassobaculaceae bacterium]|nr:adenosylcobinamide-GDP ribazoletransferase [Thalassobaculaceae bacterium]
MSGEGYTRSTDVTQSETIDMTHSASPESDPGAGRGGPTTRWFDELGLATVFLTRLPWPLPIRDLRPLMAASWAFPVVGIVIGLIGGVAFAVADTLGLPGGASALVSLAAAALATGALHEDGLADMADGFGGGRDAEGKRRIMRDSRIGSYGVLALILTVGFKAACLAELDADAAVLAMIAAHTLARGVVPALARSLPFAAGDGLGRAAGKPGRTGALWAAGIGVGAALFVLPAGIGIAAALAAGVAALGVGLLARRQIGGITGDVLGAAEQLAETAALAAITIYFAT